jgi:hypothetical protein
MPFPLITWPHGSVDGQRAAQRLHALVRPWRAFHHHEDHRAGNEAQPNP